MVWILKRLLLNEKLPSFCQIFLQNVIIIQTFYSTHGTTHMFRLCCDKQPWSDDSRRWKQNTKKSYRALLAWGEIWHYLMLRERERDWDSLYVYYTHTTKLSKKSTIFMLCSSRRQPPVWLACQWPRPKSRSCQQRSLTCKTLDWYKAILKWANWHQYKNNRSSDALDRKIDWLFVRG